MVEIPRKASCHLMELAASNRPKKTALVPRIRTSYSALPRHAVNIRVNMASGLSGTELQGPNERMRAKYAEMVAVCSKGLELANLPQEPTL